MASSEGTQRQYSKTSRRNSILDIYTLVLAIFSFASLWLFAYASKTARIDLWGEQRSCRSLVGCSNCGLLGVGVAR
jgi:hypothetical protein